MAKAVPSAAIYGFFAFLVRVCYDVNDVFCSVVGVYAHFMVICQCFASFPIFLARGRARD